MFVDRVKIHIKGGNGGNGIVSFYRAKYITHGGPDGGCLLYTSLPSLVSVP